MFSLTASYRCRLFLACLPAFLFGCAPFLSHGYRDRAYSSMVEKIPAADQSLLDGRLIVIDPGHGYGFDGAIGDGGLREADVNMWVSLYLAGMLREYGARVILTRAGEGETPTREDGALRENLRDRVELSNYLGADLFLSIHHNSSLDKRRDYNAVETYYKMGDEGPSLEAARSIHRHLAENLGLEENYLFPGNYYLLRNSDRPAVLGEASYISNSSMARKLKKREKLRLEAQAYLLGILDYFSSGRPSIQPLFSAADTVYTTRPTLRVDLLPGNDGSPVDVSSISLRIDGNEIGAGEYSVDGGLLTCNPDAPLASGEHTLQLNAKNLRGNSAIPLSMILRVSLPAAGIHLRVIPDHIPPGGRSLVLVEAYVVDSTGNSVVDGKVVKFRAKGSGNQAWAKKVSGGRASILYPAAKSGTIRFDAACEDVSTSEELKIGKSSVGQAVVILRDGKTDVPIANVSVALSRGDESERSLTSPEGYAALSAAVDGEYLLSTRKRGYRAYNEVITMKRGELSRVDLSLNPIQNSVLEDKVVVIDPCESRMDDPIVRGYRISDMNLMTARDARTLLEAGGAEVVLVRDRDVPLSPYHRVMISAESEADVHVILRHSVRQQGESIAVSNFPGSTAGERLADLLRDELSSLTGLTVGVREEASTVMRHTPSPTVAVDVAMDESSAGPDRMIRLESYSVYNALLRYFGAAEENRFHVSGIVQDNSGRPVTDALVSVDDVLTLRVDGAGRFRLRLLEDGYHHLDAVAEGFQEKDMDLPVGVGEPDSVRIILDR